MLGGEDIARRLRSLPDPVGFLESLFALLPMGMQIYSKEGRSLVTNAAFRAMFGSEPPPEYNVLEDEIAQRTGVLSLIHRAFAGETVTTPATWYDPRDLSRVSVKEGRRVCMTATFFPLRDSTSAIEYVAVIFKDVTAEVAAREASERENAWLETVIQSFPEAVYVGDHTGIKIANARALEMLGMKDMRELEQHVSEVAARIAVRDPSTGRPLPIEEQVFGRALAGTASTNEVLVTNVQTGQDMLVRSTAAPIRDDGEVVAAMAVNIDISDVRRAAEERDLFLAALGHDLRNPLSAIRLTSEALSHSTALPESARRHVARIASSADRMTRMINQLLDFARARAGGLVLARRDCDLRSICHDVIDEIARVHPHQHVFFDTHGGGRGRWDPDRLAQVVQNLVSNAVEHGAPREPIRVSIRGDASTTFLEVVNRGSPIPADARRHIFEPYRRGGHGGHGVGLGLYIAQQIVAAHGGVIEVQSDETRTSFCVRLPARQRSDVSSRQHHSRSD